MCHGADAALGPVYDSIPDLAMKLGADVQASVAKTRVIIRRKYVFAQLKPATNTPSDLGFALPVIENPPVRLLPTGGPAKGHLQRYGSRTSLRIMPVSVATQMFSSSGEAMMARWASAR